MRKNVLGRGSNMRKDEDWENSTVHADICKFFGLA